MKGGHEQQGAHASPDLNDYRTDDTLQHPRCVFQLLKKHFARYTPEMVEQYCGVAKEAFLHAAQDVLRRLRVRKKRARFVMRSDGRSIPAAFR